MKDPRVLADPSDIFGGALAAGVRVGGARYLLKRRLGRGGISEMWLAWDRTREREVALKFLPRSLLQNADLLQRLRETTERCQGVSHPAIARVYELVHDQETVGIAFQYVDGWPLAALKVDRPQKRFRLEEVRPWARTLCEALEFAHHETRLVHRGLQPSNLLLNAREQLKITDFAIAWQARAALARQGDVAYLSPQQIKGEEPSTLDDVYSLGATLYDLLTGTPPFYQGEILLQACELPPPRLNERLRELGFHDCLPGTWEEGIAACLAKDPTQRPHSVSEVWQRLEPPPPAKPAAKPDASRTEPVGSTIGQKTPEPDQAKPLAPEPAPPSIPGEQTPVAEPGAPASQTAHAPEPEAPAKLLSVKRRQRTAAVLAGAAAFMALGLAVSVLVSNWRSSKTSAARSKPTSPRPGSLDRGFNTGTGADNEVRALAIQPDGRILVGGRFVNFDGTGSPGIARVNTKGGLERGFGPRLNGTVHAIALQADGRIVLGGDFIKADGLPCRRLARLNADGTLDQAFTSQAGVNREVRSLLVQPDRKILVAGSFDQAGGARRSRITRLMPDGTPDRTFEPGGGASAMVWSLALQADGKIVAGGDFTRFASVAHARLVRLNGDGSLDRAFNTGSGADTGVLALSVQADGRILVAGSFTSFNGLPRHRLARLLPDGSVDPGFDPGDGPSGSVRSVAVQTDGKIVVGGAFENVWGVRRNGIARVNPDGKLDHGFDPGEGAVGGGIWCVSLQGDGKILAGGIFKTFNGTECGRIARLHGDAAAASKWF